MESLIRELVERDNFTLREVGKYLTDNVGIERGCSERNLQDFCCAGIFITFAGEECHN